MTSGDWVMVLGFSAIVILPSMELSDKHPWLWAIGTYVYVVIMGLALTLSLK